MLNAKPDTSAILDLLTYLQRVSVLGGRDRLDLRAGVEATHLWLPDLAAGGSNFVPELLAEGWASFSAPGHNEGFAVTSYRTLYRMLEKARDVSQFSEVRFGVGVYGEQGEKGSICYPLFSCPATLELDQRSNISVSLKGGEQWRAEQRILTEKRLPQAAEMEQGLLRLETSDRMVNDLQSLRSLLLASLPPQGRLSFSPGDEPPGSFTQEGGVFFAPVLYLQHGRETDYGKFIGQMIDRLIVDASADIPLMRQVVKGYGAAPLPDEGATELHRFLPLPTNEGQSRIAAEVSRETLLLVQGPPGTGKSYAIANLLGPLLMNRQRVLITAERGQALEAIYDKVPEGLRPFVFLCSTKEATLKSGRALLRLLEKFDRLRDTRIQRVKMAEIERYDEERTKLVTQLEADQLHRMIDLGGGYSGRLSELVDRLRADRLRFSWLRDDATGLLTGDGAQVQGFVEWQGLVNRLRRVAFDGSRTVVPHLESLPTPELLREYRDRRRDYEAAQKGTVLRPQAGITSGQVADKLKRLRDWHTQIPQHRWAVSAAWELGDPTSKWHQIEKDTDSCLAGLALLDPEALLGSTTVTFRPSTPEASDAVVPPLHLRPRLNELSVTELRQLIKDLEELLILYGERLRLGWMDRKIWASGTLQRLNYLFKEVSIDGRVGDERTHLERVLRYAKVLVGLARLDDCWGAYRVYEIQPEQKLNAYKSRARHLSTLLESYPAVGRDRKDLERWFRVPQGRFGDGPGLETVETALWVLKIREKIGEAEQLIQAGLDELRRYDSNISYIADAVDNLVAADVPGYLNTYEKLTKLADYQADYQQQLKLEGGLSEYLPKTLAHFKAKVVGLKGAAEVRLALQYVRARSVLDELCSAGTVGPLRELRQLDDHRLRQVEHYLTATGRLNFIDSLANQGLFKAKLRLWLAGEERKQKAGSAGALASADAFAYISDYLPCLAMTVGDVTKRLFPRPELFDVLIVDEASQLSAAALSMLYLAKKAVVIGDDKQISPTNSFVRNTAFTEIQHLVAGLPQGAYFQKGSSFFDHVKLVASREIQLREHFRCQPEIIAFSDEICYRGADDSIGLLPLRQAERGRLLPLRTQYVGDATIDDKKRNEREAEAIVARILDLVGDSAYAGRSLGVITLLGDHQHRLISRLLDKSGLPSIDRAARKLKVGKPADFQGDERDVVLLSLVTAPNKVSTIPWTSTFTQRFNVAVSRAKDQVILFHSRTMAELPSGKLPQRLLSHCENYQLERVLGKEDLPEQQDERVLPAGFRSHLQFDLAQMLFKRSYSLLRDYRLGSLVIDLVIERSDGLRVAIFCLDPDEYTDEDTREALVAQQLILQRVGWLVYVVNGCHFAHNGEAVVEGLVDFVEG